MAEDPEDEKIQQDRINTIIRQVIGKEPFPSSHQLGPDSSSSEEHPLSPLHECVKCSRTFFSSINHRRHVLVEHRLQKSDKDSKKNMDLIGAYWDKLSVEETKELTSFNNVMLEEVPGSKILKALATLVKNPEPSSLPRYYLWAGAVLSGIVQTQPCFFPISSRELFRSLDEASERTCFCGTTVSMQRQVFDGEAGKIALEPGNLIVCISFLLEQKLENAWLADKEAEALRCQKVLVEEEETAQKRQAQISEKKRKKKLRRKEQKEMEQRHEDEAEIKGTIDSTIKASSGAEASMDTYDFDALNSETYADKAPSHVPFQCPGTNEGGFEPDQAKNRQVLNFRQSDSKEKTSPKPKSEVDWVVSTTKRKKKLRRKKQKEREQRHEDEAEIKEQRKGNKAKNHQILNFRQSDSEEETSPKAEPDVDRVVSKTIAERKPYHAKNRQVLNFRQSDSEEKISPKPKPDVDRVVSETIAETKPDQAKNRQVLNFRQSDSEEKTSQTSPKPKPEADRKVSKTISERKPDQAKNHQVLDFIQPDSEEKTSPKPKSEVDRVVSKTIAERKLDQAKNPQVLNFRQSDSEDKTSPKPKLEVDSVVSETIPERKPDQAKNRQVLDSRQSDSEEKTSPKPKPEVDCVVSETIPERKPDQAKNSQLLNFRQLDSEFVVDLRRIRLWFNIRAAQSFQERRWREAISSNQAEWVVSPDSESPEVEIVGFQSSGVDRSNILENAEDQLPVTSEVTSKPPWRKSGKGTKMKYIPKQNTTN